MRLLLRFIIPLLAVLGLMSLLLAPIADGLIERWFQYDVEIRSKLIANSVSDALVRMINDPVPGEIEALFDRIAEDERVLAVGRCAPDRGLLEASRNGRSIITCGAELLQPTVTLQRIDSSRGPILAASFPVLAREQRSNLLIVHDMAFASARSRSARLYVVAFIVLLALAASGVTILVAQLTLRGWLRSVRQGLSGKPGRRPDDPQIAPVVAEMRQLLRDLDISRRTAAGIRVDWSPETLRRVVENELPAAEVIVVSNREPYIHVVGADGQISLQRPASGLVTALEPIVKACGGTWIAHGSGSGDRESVDARDRLKVPPDEPSYTLRRIWLNADEEEGYYYGLSNEGLWPLCHITFVRPIFRQSDWERYRRVNQKFAEAVVAEAKTDSPIVLVQDYHLALVPRLLRERLPGQRSLRSGIYRGPTRKCLGFARGGKRSSKGCSPARSSGFIPSFTATTSLRLPTASFAVTSIASTPRCLSAPIPPSSVPILSRSPGLPSIKMCRRRGVARRCSAASDFPPTRAWRSASSASTSPRAFPTASEPSKSCSKDCPSGAGGLC